jgi:ABC-2 type transport system permease protein
MNWNPLALLGVIVIVVLGAALFSTFSLIIGCLVKTRERFMGIGQVMTIFKTRPGVRRTGRKPY